MPVMFNTWVLIYFIPNSAKSGDFFVVNYLA